MNNYRGGLWGLIRLVKESDIVVNEPPILERLEAEERAYEEWAENQRKEGER